MLKKMDTKALLFILVQYFMFPSVSFGTESKTTKYLTLSKISLSSFEVKNQIYNRVQVLNLNREQVAEAKNKNILIEEILPVKTVNFFESNSPQIRNTVVWPLQLIRANEAHDVGELGKGERVCIDSGVDKDHPQLKGKNIAGLNFVDNEDQANLADETDIKHGTLLASLIVGNRIGNFVGVAPEADLYVAKIFDKSGASSTDQVARAIQYCESVANVIHMSFGMQKSSNILSALMKSASKKGITIIAAAGNTEQILFPAIDKSVIAVASIAENLQFPNFNPLGVKIGFVAPGVDVPILAMEGQTKQFSGSSFSAAYVTGAELLRRAAGSAILRGASITHAPELEGMGLIDAFGSIGFQK